MNIEIIKDSMKRISMSENLKKYRLNIIGGKITLDGIDESIVAIISTIGILTAFAPATLPKKFLVPVILIILIILIVIRFFVRQAYKKIEADNNYLDEEVLLLKEYAHELEYQQKQSSINFRLLTQVQGFVAALDYMLECQRKIIGSEELNFEQVTSILNDTFGAIYNSLHNGFEDYQEKITLALYVYSQETGKFLDFISYKPFISTQKKGRIWDKDDDAHICYVARHPEHTEFIFNDINNDLPVPQNVEDSDKNNYVSSISIPIYFRNNEIRAVLSITSNYTSRFDRKSANGFKNYCNTILISYFNAIAKMVELILNNRFPNNNNTILWHTITDYKKFRSEQITKDLENLLQSLK